MLEHVQGLCIFKIVKKKLKKIKALEYLVDPKKNPPETRIRLSGDGQEYLKPLQLSRNHLREAIRLKQKILKSTAFRTVQRLCQSHRTLAAVESLSDKLAVLFEDCMEGRDFSCETGFEGIETISDNSIKANRMIVLRNLLRSPKTLQQRKDALAEVLMWGESFGFNLSRDYTGGKEMAVLLGLNLVGNGETLDFISTLIRTAMSLRLSLAGIDSSLQSKALNDEIVLAYDLLLHECPICRTFEEFVIWPPDSQSQLLQGMEALHYLVKSLKNYHSGWRSPYHQIALSSLKFHLKKWRDSEMDPSPNRKPYRLSDNYYNMISRMAHLEKSDLSVSDKLNLLLLCLHCDRVKNEGIDKESAGWAQSKVMKTKAFGVESSKAVLLWRAVLGAHQDALQDKVGNGKETICTFEGYLMNLKDTGSGLVSSFVNSIFRETGLPAGTLPDSQEIRKFGSTLGGPPEALDSDLYGQLRFTIWSVRDLKIQHEKKPLESLLNLLDRHYHCLSKFPEMRDEINFLVMSLCKPQKKHFKSAIPLKLEADPPFPAFAALVIQLHSIVSEPGQQAYPPMLVSASLWEYVRAGVRFAPVCQKQVLKITKLREILRLCNPRQLGSVGSVMTARSPWPPLALRDAVFVWAQFQAMDDIHAGIGREGGSSEGSGLGGCRDSVRVCQPVLWHGLRDLWVSCPAKFLCEALCWTLYEFWAAEHRSPCAGPGNGGGRSTRWDPRWERISLDMLSMALVSLAVLRFRRQKVLDPAAQQPHPGSAATTVAIGGTRGQSALVAAAADGNGQGRSEENFVRGELKKLALVWIFLSRASELPALSDALLVAANDFAEETTDIWAWGAEVLYSPGARGGPIHVPAVAPDSAKWDPGAAGGPGGWRRSLSLVASDLAAELVRRLDAVGDPAL